MQNCQQQEKLARLARQLYNIIIFQVSLPQNFRVIFHINAYNFTT